MLSFDWKSRHILVVDGDDQFRFWARGLFKQQRVAEIVSFPGVHDAKAAASQNGFDIALLELGHDDAALLAFLRWLRDGGKSPSPALPVILLAKSMERAHLREACALGIHGVVKKPLSADLLLKAVSSVCRNPRRIQLAEEPEQKAPLVVPEAVEPPTARRSAASAVAEPKAAVPRRLSSHSPASAAPVVSRPSRDALDVAPPPAIKAPEYVEIVETPPPAAKSDEAYWDDELPKAKVSSDEDWSEALGPSKKKKKRTDDQGIELPPLANDGKPVQGRDLDAVLAEHCLWVDSKGAQGKRADLEGEDLSGRTLAEASLTNANLKKTDLSGSDLTEALLHGADLRYAEIIGGQMQGSNLAVARLRHAHLRGCQLQGANFNGADLAGADLSGSIFDGAEMKGANLLGVKLDDADLSGAKGLSQAQLEGVSGNAKTKLPPGLRLPV